MRFSRAALVLCLFPFAFSGCADKSPSSTGGTSTPSSGGSSASGGTPIVIGEYASLTGKEATFGQSQSTGVQLAIDKVNKEGGINGHPLKLQLEDEEGKSESATSVVKKLITQDKATAIIGEVASTISIAGGSVCNPSKVPMISPSSTNPKVTIGKPYVFRVCFIDPYQGGYAAKFAAEELKAKKIAILYDSTAAYSIGLKDVMATEFPKLGGTIVTSPSYISGDADFKAQLTTIKAASPDVLYVPGYYNEVGVIARQAREVGLTVPILGGDGWDSPKLIEGAGGPGGALEGAYFTNHSSMDSPDPIIKNFVADYKVANNGKKPDTISALGYDAVGVLANAMKTVGKPESDDYTSETYRTKLRDAIAQTKDFKGVTGEITLNENRDAVKPVFVLQIKGNSYVFVKKYSP